MHINIHVHKIRVISGVFVLLEGVTPHKWLKRIHPDKPQQSNWPLINDVCSYLTFPPLSPFTSSLLFLQVDNRPCSRLPSTCFPYATEAASFLNAVRMRSPPSFSSLPKLTAVIDIRGVREEIGNREEETVKKEVKGKLSCPVSPSHTPTHTLPALNSIQTKHHKHLFHFQCVDVLMVSAARFTFSCSNI